MGLTIGSWLSNNWLGVLAVVVGVWIPFALRSPPAKIRYWTASDISPIYLIGATCTKLNLRNVGNQAITADQWRVPLSIECADGITGVQVVGVSYPDIKASVQFTRGRPNWATLDISRLDPGDEVAFEIRHGKTSKPPEVKGEIRGAPESLVPGLTMAQRLATLPSVLMGLIAYYIPLSSIAWLAELRLNASDVLRGLLFLLASPLLDIIVSPLLRRKAWEKHPTWTPVLFIGVPFVGIVAGAIGLIVAWLSGYQLWYPQFAAFIALAWLLVRVLTRTPFSAISGVVAREEVRGSRAMATFFTGVTTTAFAACVAAGVKISTLIWVGLIAALVFAISRMDRQSLTHRLTAAIGNPRSQLLSPTLGSPRSQSRRPRPPVGSIRVGRRHPPGSPRQYGRRNNLRTRS
jgi:hypothetical protein